MIKMHGMKFSKNKYKHYFLKVNNNKIRGDGDQDLQVKKYEKVNFTRM